MAHFGKEKEETLTVLWISPTLDLIMHPLISWAESQLVRLPSLSGLSRSPSDKQTTLQQQLCAQTHDPPCCLEDLALFISN